MASSVCPGQCYGDIHISDFAKAHIGNEYVTHVYQSVGDDLPQECKRKAFLEALAYKAMNDRRNQITETKDVEWIWTSSLSNASIKGQPETSTTDTARSEQKRRAALSYLWGFDQDNDKLWHAIKSELNSLHSDLLAHAAPYGDPGFSEWLTSSDPIFWISGKPASGKSTLMKYLANHSKCSGLLRQSSGTRWELLHFFFDFRAQDGTANSMTGMFKLLLFQLIQKIPQAVDYFSKHPITQDLNIRNNDLSIEQMQTVFQSCVVETRSHVCIFVDGLDEFTGSHPVLLKVLRSLADGVHVKMCVASRPEAAIQNTLKQVPALRMQDHNHTSIAIFAADTFGNATDSRDDPEAFWRLVAHVVGQASGVFLWAHLVCADVYDGMLTQETPDELNMRISTYPAQLDDVYARLLSKLDRRFGEETSLALHLIMHYPNDNPEDDATPDCDYLQHMLEILRDCGTLPTFPVATLSGSAFETRLLSRLGGLIDLVPSTKYWKSDVCQVRLIHKTLASYLTSSGFLLSLLPQAFMDAYPDHLWLRIYCTYISQSRFLDRWPLRRLVERGALDQEAQALREHLHEDARLLRAEAAQTNPAKRLDAKSEQELSRLLLASSLSLCRAQKLAYNLETYDLIRDTLLTAVRQLHGFCYLCGDGSERSFMLSCSVDEHALTIGLAYGLWDHAQALSPLVSSNPQLRAMCAKVLVSTLCARYNFPGSIGELDYWMERTAPEIQLADFIVGLNLEFVSGATGSHVSRFLAHRPPKPWPVVQPAELDTFRWLTSWINPSNENNISYQVCVNSMVGYWERIFKSPVPSWINSDGTTCLFFVAMFFAAEGRQRLFRRTSASLLLGWVDLLIWSGEELNRFCYPNGTFLHLVIECLSFGRETVKLIQGLLDRGIDVAIKGPSGTALEIAQTLPSSKSRLFELKTYYHAGEEGIIETSDTDNDGPGIEENFTRREASEQTREDVRREREQAIGLEVIELLEKAMKQEADVRTSWTPPSPRFWLESYPRDYNEDGRLRRTSSQRLPFRMDYY